MLMFEIETCLSDAWWSIEEDDSAPPLAADDVDGCARSQKASLLVHGHGCGVVADHCFQKTLVLRFDDEVLPALSDFLVGNHDFLEVSNIDEV